MEKEKNKDSNEVSKKSLLLKILLMTDVPDSVYKYT